MVLRRRRADPGRGRAAPRGTRTRFLAGAAALYLAAGVAGTWPAAREPTAAFAAAGAPGHGGVSPGDHLQAAYNLWLPGHQLERGAAPWLDPYSFQPESPERVNFAGWPLGLLFWPLDAAFGLVGAWNLLSVLVVAVSGGLACAWLRELGLPRGAALVGGLAFALAPYRVAQSTEHLLGPVSALLPLALWAFERRRAWLAAVALASIPLAGQVHLALGAVPFFAAYALVRTRDPRRLVGAAAAVVAALAGGLLVRALAIEDSIAEGGRSLAAVDAYSAGFLDLLLREPRHGLERYVFLGWATAALAVAGLVLLRDRLALLLGGAAVVGILFALGTNTPVYTALWHVLPPLQFPRVPGRVMPVACLALAALAAFAVARVRPRWGAVAAGAVVAADLLVLPFAPSAADEANAAVAATPAGRVLEVPVLRPDIHYGGAYLYYSTQRPRERPAGYSTTADPDALRVAAALERLNCGDWTGPAAQLVRGLGVTAVTLHRPLFVANRFVAHTPAFAAWGLARNGFRRARADGPVELWVRGVQPAVPPPASDPVYCQGWRLSLLSGRVMTSSYAALWIHGAGRARLELSAPAPLRAVVAVNGRDARTVLVGEERRSVAVVLDRPGWNLVSLRVPRLARELGRPAGVALRRVTSP